LSRTHTSASLCSVWSRVGLSVARAKAMFPWIWGRVHGEIAQRVYISVAQLCDDRGFGKNYGVTELVCCGGVDTKIDMEDIFRVSLSDLYMTCLCERNW